jgi:hypothetical protein
MRLNMSLEDRQCYFTGSPGMLGGVPPLARANVINGIRSYAIGFSSAQIDRGESFSLFAGRGSNPDVYRGQKALTILTRNIYTAMIAEQMPS